MPLSSFFPLYFRSSFHCLSWILVRFLLLPWQTPFSLFPLYRLHFYKDSVITAVFLLFDSSFWAFFNFFTYNEEALLSVLIQEHPKVAHLASSNRTFSVCLSPLSLVGTFPSLSPKKLVTKCSASDVINSLLKGLPENRHRWILMDQLAIFL